MIGTIKIATVIEKSYAKPAPGEPRRPNGVVVSLEDGDAKAKGFLSVDRMSGRTPGHRLGNLAALKPGDLVAVYVVSGRLTFDGEPGYRVDQRAAMRRARKEKAELFLRNGVIKGIVRRVAGNHAIVQLPDELRGRLHVSRVVGDSEEERTARLNSLAPGRSIRVKVSAVSDESGRFVVRLVEVHFPSVAA